MSSGSLSVLFVDDEPKILDGLRRTLHNHRARWTMRFASSGAEAMQLLLAEPSDVVVADMRMPGMTGGELLKMVHDLFPQTTRIVLSGQTDPFGLSKHLGSVHHFLQKPCDPAVMCRAIERTHELGLRLESPRMRLAVNRIVALPPGTENYCALRDELRLDGADISRVAALVARDPALTAKVVQLVSSAFFGLPRRVDDPHDAVVLLGINTIQTIVIAGHIFGSLERDDPHREAIAHLWNASVHVGELAARYAQDSRADHETQKRARLAGVLSMVGRAVLLTSEAKSYEQVFALAREKGISLAAAETETYGVSYAEVGAYALGLWGMSDTVVHAVATQMAPSAESPANDVSVFVHLARWALGGPPRSIDEKPSLHRIVADRRDVKSLIHQQRESA